MKLTKEQEDFLGICWKMKVVNIMPQALKLGIPEVEVRRYLETKGLTIDRGHFVFTPKPQPGTSTEWALRKWFVIEKISDEDFRTAMTEAYWLFSLAIDHQTAARMRRQSRVGVAGATSKAELAANGMVERRRDEIVLLLGGLMGLYLPADNEAMLKRARELCNHARERSQAEGSASRSSRERGSSHKGSPAPTSHRNASDRLP